MLALHFNRAKWGVSTYTKTPLAKKGVFEHLKDPSPGNAYVHNICLYISFCVPVLTQHFAITSGVMHGPRGNRGVKIKQNTLPDAHVNIPIVSALPISYTYDMIRLVSMRYQRLSHKRWSDICSVVNCSCDDISNNNELEWEWWLGFGVRGSGGSTRGGGVLGV